MWYPTRISASSNSKNEFKKLHADIKKARESIQDENGVLIRHSGSCNTFRIGRRETVARAVTSSFVLATGKEPKGLLNRAGYQEPHRLTRLLLPLEGCGLPLVAGMSTTSSLAIADCSARGEVDLFVSTKGAFTSLPG